MDACMSRRILIFDFDGVLADTRDDIVRFAEIVCAQLGHPCTATPEDLDALDQMSFDSLARRLGLPEDKVKAFTERSFVLFNARKRPPGIIEGVAEVITRLAVDCRIGIVSGNNSETVHRFLDHHGLAPFIDVVLTANDPGSRVEKIVRVAERLNQPGAEVYVIGDAVSDIRAARQALVKSIAVTWGHQSRERLEAVGPDDVVHSPGQLLALCGVGSSAMSRRKVFCYIVRSDGDRPRLLVFGSLDEPGFEVPKGAVEADETLEQAAVREIFEESGITAVQVIKRLGITNYLQEEQHFFLLKATQELPLSFNHRVTGEGIDQGFQYHFRWLGLSPALHDALVQGCQAFVGELLDEFGQHGTKQEIGGGHAT
jgi:phosphoglycolate phosphatase-like HAD superfamily hydrolase/8-oxo-dGTP pyrophosphatase MutT (NUDIX family)